ncbi:hypothetical protein TcWFU_007907 [Taenia crassiceps]|uniref:Uncharacterized protein n=1 Tax=Taenia crassiceps TaxID=6207 RepID=A0ABR4QME8_9CEST
MVDGGGLRRRCLRGKAWRLWPGEEEEGGFTRLRGNRSALWALPHVAALALPRAAAQSCGGAIGTESQRNLMQFRHHIHLNCLTYHLSDFFLLYFVYPPVYGR